MYLDDFAIFLGSINEHLDHLLAVLGLHSKAGASLSVKKGLFFESLFDYSGHVVKPCSPCISTELTRADHILQKLTSVAEFKAFLWLCNPFKRFLPNFAHLAALLNGELGVVEPVRSGPLQETEIETMWMLQRWLLSPPLLAVSRLKERYTLSTDACDKQVPWDLLVEDPGRPQKQLWVLAGIVWKRWTRVRHRASGTSCSQMGRPAVEL